MILGISGGIASGKTYVSQIILKKYSLFYTSFSEVLKTYCARQKIEPTRDILQNLGKEIIENHGAEGFVKWIISQSQMPAENVLLDGFRHPAVWDSFKKIYPQARLIFCDINQNEQKRRIQKRDKIPDQIATKILAHPIEQEVSLLKEKASVIFNETTTQEDIIKWIRQPICIKKKIIPLPTSNKEHIIN